MEKANKKEIAWELNLPAVIKDPEFFHRYFQIGKEVGVVFNIGTDGHELSKVNSLQFVDIYKKILY